MMSLGKRLLFIVTIAALLGLASAGCGNAPVAAIVAKSNVPRDLSPQVPDSDVRGLVSGDTEFALDLYHVLSREEGNLFYSPYSISLALSMTYAGARGETEQEMAQTLHFTLPQERLHPAFNALSLELDRLGEPVEQEAGRGFRLNVANSLWGQRGHGFLSEFLDVLARNYGAGLRLIDYISDPESARVSINDWVSQQTEGKIEDLISRGLITPATRLVLANAIYFNAAWAEPYNEANTHEEEFHLLDGTHIVVPMMTQRSSVRYAEQEGLQVVELPYVGGEVAMVVLLPAAGGFSRFESSLDSDGLRQILESLEVRSVEVTLPKFEFDSSLDLEAALVELGMKSAFSGEADFSGMDGSRGLFVGAVVHKAFVSVDEAGTEAAAATAVIAPTLAMPEPPVEFKVDRPFVFILQDMRSGTILFMGRVLNPGQ